MKKLAAFSFLALLVTSQSESCIKEYLKESGSIPNNSNQNERIFFPSEGGSRTSSLPSSGTSTPTRHRNNKNQTVQIQELKQSLEKIKEKTNILEKFSLLFGSAALSLFIVSLNKRSS